VDLFNINLRLLIIIFSILICVHFCSFVYIFVLCCEVCSLCGSTLLREDGHSSDEQSTSPHLLVSLVADKHSQSQ
jgi:hypothetical protein